MWRKHLKQCEGKVDPAIITERYQDIEHREWHSDDTGTSALWVRNLMALPISGFGRGDGFVWAKSGEVTIISVYLSPNKGTAMFHKKLGELHSGLEEASRCSRGLQLQGTGMGNELVMQQRYGHDRDYVQAWPHHPQRKRVPTFRRSGCRGTIIDITLASDGAAARFHEWRVMENFTGNDHKHITFVIEGSRSPLPRAGSLRNDHNGGRQVPHWDIDL